MANDRVTQLPVEAAVSPTDQKGRITQLPVETAVSPTDQKGRVTQMVVEVAIRNLRETIQVLLVD